MTLPMPSLLFIIHFRCIFEQLKCLGKLPEEAVSRSGTCNEEEAIEDEIATPEMSVAMDAMGIPTTMDNRSHLTAVITPYNNSSAEIPVPVQNLRLPLEVSMPNQRMEVSSGASVYRSPYSHGFTLSE